MFLGTAGFFMQNSGWISYLTDATPMRLRAWRTLNGLRLTRTRIHIVLRPRHTRASVLSSFPYKSSFVHARADNINFLFSVSPFCLRGKAAREGTATRKVSRPRKPDRAKKREGKVRRWLERRQMLCGGQEEDPRPPPSNAKKTAEAAAGSHI